MHCNLWYDEIQACHCLLLAVVEDKGSQNSDPLLQAVAVCFGPPWQAMAGCGSLWQFVAVCGSQGQTQSETATNHRCALTDWRQTDKLPIIGDCKAGKASGAIISLQLESVIHRMPKFSNWAWRRNHSMKIYSGDGPVVKLEGRTHLDSSSLKFKISLELLCYSMTTAPLHWIPSFI